MLPDGASPRPPASCAPKSLIMSPKRLQVTMTSNWLGSRTISIARLAIYKWRGSVPECYGRRYLQTGCRTASTELFACALWLLHTRFLLFLPVYAHSERIMPPRPLRG